MRYTEAYLLLVACLLVLLSLLLTSKSLVLQCLAVVVLALLANGKLGSSARLVRRRGSSLVPVGGGWSFYLCKLRLDGRPVRAGLVGKLANGRWGADTRIADLQRCLAMEGKTVSSHPSVENGTLGGWIASGSHGSGGTLWRPCFGRVVVQDMHTGAVFQAMPKDVFNDRTSIEDDRRYLILEVEIEARDDVLCKKTASKMMSSADAARFLEADSLLRILQIGRRGTMCLLWEPLQQDDHPLCNLHYDPHIGSQIGLWLQADVLSILQSSASRHSPWFSFPVEPKENYTSCVLLSEANKFTPEIPLLLSPVGLAFRNFELFVECDLSADSLFCLCNALSDAFDATPGRCELRRGRRILFLDFVVPVWCDPTPLLDAASAVISLRGASWHKGKWRPLVFEEI